MQNFAAIDGTAVLTMVEFELLHEQRRGDDPWQEALDCRTIHPWHTVLGLRPLLDQICLRRLMGN